MTNNKYTFPDKKHVEQTNKNVKKNYQISVFFFVKADIFSFSPNFDVKTYKKTISSDKDYILADKDFSFGSAI